MVMVSLFVFLIIELIIVSIVDFRTRKIKNYWHLINIIIFGIGAIVSRGEFYVWTYHFIAPLAMFLIGFLLFRFPVVKIKIMGGGDAKLLTGIFLIIPTQYHIEFAEKLLIITIIIATLILLQKVLSNLTYIVGTRFWGVLSLIGGSKFPYSPIVLMSMLWLIMQRNILNL